MTTQLKASEVKNSLRPLEFYRYELPAATLKRQGWVNGGLCPFHADNTPGSFYINTTTGAYKCFSCQSSGGDIIAFTMALYNLSFIEALSKLAREWGIS